MNVLYLILICLFLLSSIMFYIKFQKISKKLSESNFKNENNSLLKENEILNLNNKKNENQLTEANKNIEYLKQEILVLKESFIHEKQKIFDDGIKKGKELSNYRIEVEPYKEISKNKKFFGSEDQLNIGRKYIMFINDTITPFSHIEIFETVSHKEINEDRVNSILSKITDLTTNLTPVSNIKLVGNIAEFGGKLLNFKK